MLLKNKHLQNAGAYLYYFILLNIIIDEIKKNAIAIKKLEPNCGNGIV